MARQRRLLNQQISTNNHNNSYGTTASYLEPLSQFLFLNLTIAFNRSTTANNKHIADKRLLHRIQNIRFLLLAVVERLKA